MKKREYYCLFENDEPNFHMINESIGTLKLIVKIHYNYWSLEELLYGRDCENKKIYYNNKDESIFKLKKIRMEIIKEEVSI